MLATLVAPFANASTNAGLSYHGRILDPNGQPVQKATIDFKLQVRTPNSSNCLLYEEAKSIDMTNSNGLFSLTINDGIGTILSGSYSLDQVFSNRKTFNVTNTNLDCTGPRVYNPSPADGRKFVVYFKERSSSTWEQLPSQDINFVPQAFQALQVGGFGPEDLMRFEHATTETIDAFTFTDYDKLVQLIAGTSSLYQKAGQLNGATVATPSAGQVLGWNGTTWAGITPITTESDPTVPAWAKASLPTCTAGQVLSVSSGALTCVTDATGGTPGDASTSAKGLVQISATGGLSISAGVLSLPDTVTAGTYVKVTTDAKGRITGGQAKLDDTDLNTIATAGKVSGSAITSGDISTTGAFTTTNNISTSGTLTATTAVRSSDLQIFDGGSHYIHMKAPTLTADYNLTWPSALPGSNKVLQVSSLGVLSWVDASAGSVTSVTASAPLSVATGTSTPAISITKATGSVDGYLAAADFTTFSGKQDKTLTTGKIWIGNSGVAAEQTITGDLSLSATGVAAVNRIAGFPLDFTTTAPTTGKFVKYDGTNFVPSSPQISDVTNLQTQLDAKVAMSSIPGNCGTNQTLIFSTPSNTWACGNISVAGSAFGSQTQKTFLAAPNAADGSPTFRGIASSDLPMIPVSGGGTGISAGTQGGIPYFTGTGSMASSGVLSQYQVVLGGGSGSAPSVVSGTGTTGQVLVSNGTGSAPTWQNAPSASTGLFGAGSATNPSISFSANSNTGFYNDGSGNILISTNANSRGKFGSDGEFYWNNDLVSKRTLSTGIDGAAYPNYAFNVSGSGNSMGMFYISSDNLGFSTASTERVRIDNNGNVGIGTTSPGTMLDVKGGIRPGSATVVTATCNTANEGIQRYNYSTHFMEYCNGSNWVQLTTQAAGTTTPVYVSGPPVGAGTYTFTSATGNYTPGFGNVNNTINGNWPGAGTSATGNTNCVELDTQTSSTQMIVYDLGTNRSIGKVYVSTEGSYFNSMKPIISFSTDNITYSSSLWISNGGSGDATYVATTLGTAVTARYVRLTNGDSNTYSPNSYSSFCQIAVGP